MPASSAVVLDLAKPILNQGHVIYVDNWYNSPNLCKLFLDNNTHIMGTANQTRVNMPVKFNTSQLEVGEVMRMSEDGILAVQWRDKKVLQMLSTIYEGMGMAVTKEVIRKGQTVEVLKPKSVIDYNNGMLGVDIRPKNGFIPNNVQNNKSI